MTVWRPASVSLGGRPGSSCRPDRRSDAASRWGNRWLARPGSGRPRRRPRCAAGEPRDCCRSAAATARTRATSVRRRASDHHRTDGPWARSGSAGRSPPAPRHRRRCHPGYWPRCHPRRRARCRCLPRSRCQRHRRTRLPSGRGSQLHVRPGTCRGTGCRGGPRQALARRHGPLAGSARPDGAARTRTDATAGTPGGPAGQACAAQHLRRSQAWRSVDRRRPDRPRPRSPGVDGPVEGRPRSASRRERPAGRSTHRSGGPPCSTRPHRLRQARPTCCGDPDPAGMPRSGRTLTG
jgi:hypothetical protein